MKRLTIFLIAMAWTGGFLMNPETVTAMWGFHPDSIRLVYNDQQTRLPGESFQIGITAFFRNGKTRNTAGWLGGSVWWGRYRVEVTGGTFTSGKVIVSEKLMPSRGKYVRIKVWPRNHPDMARQLLLPLNYETGLDFIPDSPFDKFPGSRIKGVLAARFDNGKVVEYEYPGKKEVADCFAFMSDGGSWDRGRFTIDPDFTRIVNHLSSLYIHSLRNPEVTDTFSVLMDYRHRYELTFTGMPGSGGFSGREGTSGNSGGYGENGQPGEDGEDGEHGPDVGVWSDLYRDSLLGYDLLYVFALNFRTNEEFRYLINPEGGSLTVVSRGGDGGSGGTGGGGGAGGDGRDGKIWTEKHKEKRIIQQPVTRKVIKKEKRSIINAAGQAEEVEVDVETTVTVMEDAEVEVEVVEQKQGPGENGYPGGCGGNGGYGGSGGWGGNIELYFTKDAMPWKNLIVARSAGGNGGFHGSGGHGGPGGRGGQGHPDGETGIPGRDGFGGSGTAENGSPGRITSGNTEEFCFSVPKQ